MSKFDLVVKSKGRRCVLTFHSKLPDHRVSFRVQPTSNRPWIEALLEGGLDERGILLERGSGSCLGVAKVLQELGCYVSGIPDYQTSEVVQ